MLDWKLCFRSLWWIWWRVLINSAIAKAINPIMMAKAMKVLYLGELLTSCIVVCKCFHLIKTKFLKYCFCISWFLCFKWLNILYGFLPVFLWKILLHYQHLQFFHAAFLLFLNQLIKKLIIFNKIYLKTVF